MPLRNVRWPDLEPMMRSYWLMMQIAMVLGFVATYPVNWRLIRRGQGGDVAPYPAVRAFTIRSGV